MWSRRRGERLNADYELAKAKVAAGELIAITPPDAGRRQRGAARRGGRTRSPSNAAGSTIPIAFQAIRQGTCRQFRADCQSAWNAEAVARWMITTSPQAKHSKHWTSGNPSASGSRACSRRPCRHLRQVGSWLPQNSNIVFSGSVDCAFVAGNARDRRFI